MKKANGAIYIPNMNADSFQKICDEKGLQFVYVPVPPHGRLIDADALKRSIYDYADAIGISNMFYFDEVIQSAFENAPTIIPAEEETCTKN